MRPFSDHFSALSASYASYRPHYPPGLFQALAELVADRGRVWDCATGSGQAATGLAEHFGEVIATDASLAQLRAAWPHRGVRYVTGLAEAPPLRTASMNLVTVAQALHWLEMPQFFTQARRVLLPGGVLAAWTYGRHQVDGGPIDAVLDHFYLRVVGSFWPPERRWVETGYRTLRFPFAELPLTSPPMRAEWTLEQMLGYIATWSAVARCRASAGADPMPALADRLAPLWGDPGTARRIEWPLSLRVGR